MLFLIPIIYLKKGLIKLEFKNVWKPAVLLISLAAIMHGVNMLIRNFELGEANYFYTYGLHGDPITDFFWNLIPYNFFFLLPAILLFVPYILVITFIKVKNEKF